MNKNIAYVLTFILFMNSLVFISCSKEEESPLPQISISSPIENDIISAGDTVTVIASIQDDGIISRVVVFLKDENNTPVLSQERSVGKSSYELNMLFPLTDKSLDGRYYFEVRAYDENNFASAFRYVQIKGSAAKNKAHLLFRESNGETEFAIYDSSTRFVSSYQGDLLETALDEKTGNIYICGWYTGDLNAIDTSGKILWKHSNASSSFSPYFNDLLVYEGKVFTSLEEGRIIGFDESGNRFFDEYLDNEFRIDQIHRFNDRFIYEKVRKFDAQRMLRHVYYPSGQIVNEQVFTYGAIQSFHTMSNTEVIILSNDGNNQYILNYNPQNFALSVLESNSNLGLIGTSIKINEDEISFVQGDELFVYNRSSKNTSKALLEAPRCLRLDSDLSTLWMALTSLTSYDIKGQPWQQTSIIPHWVKSFEIYASF